MPRPRKIVTLNFTLIEAAINRGETLKLKVLAAEYGTCPPVIKRYLSEHFGDKIEFVPGRNGGVRAAASSPTTANINTPDLTAVA